MTSISLMMSNCPQVGTVRIKWPISKCWGYGHIWARTKLDISHLVSRLTVTSCSMCMIKFYIMWVNSGQCDLLKFWEISANISKIVRWRYSKNERLIGNHTCPIEWHQYQWPWVILKVTLAVWHLSNPYSSGDITCINYDMCIHRWKSICSL